MPSSPPHIRSSSVPPLVPAMERAPARGPREGSALCFAVEGAPPGTSETEELGRGDLAITTRLRGRILSVMDDVLEIDHDGWIARIRCLLPEELDLEPLAGLKVEADVRLVLRRTGAAVVDAVVRDLEGGLVLWARDGALPSDRESQGVVVRVAQEPDAAPELVLATGAGMTRLVEGGSADLLLGEEPARALALRVAPDEASFVLFRA